MTEVEHYEVLEGADAPRYGGEMVLCEVERSQLLQLGYFTRDFGQLVVIKAQRGQAGEFLDAGREGRKAAAIQICL